MTLGDGVDDRVTLLGAEGWFELTAHLRKDTFSLTVEYVFVK
jgi:hypothetical protein